MSSATGSGVSENARRLASGGLWRTLAWQVARTVSRLAFAGSAALVLGRMIMGGGIETWMFIAVPLSLGLSILAGFAAEETQATAETRVARDLRGIARLKLGNMPARMVQSVPAGDLIVGMQRHPEAVAALAIGHRAATLMMAIGPLTAAAALFLVSWQAALTVLGLTPVMILFFALVGETIRKRAEAQERAFGQLAGQFADRIRALPTILANHALTAEETKLEGRLQAYASNTMGVLRIAFLNAGVIDFFASLSIAILAVLLGLGHLKLATIPGFSNLELWQSLFILMIAPEYFAPFRRYAEQYHAKAEGLAAASALDGLLNPKTPIAPSLPALDRLADPSTLPERGLVAIVGPSGSGKSTLLRRLAGVDGEAGPFTGQPKGSGISWVSTDSFVPSGTLADAIGWETTGVDSARLLLAAGRVRLLDDTLLPGGLNAPVENGGANLSGGQRMRIAVARALLRDGIVIADEPTAKLDAETAEAVRETLRGMATARLVVVATHDPRLIGLADRRIDLSMTGIPETAP